MSWIELLDGILMSDGNLTIPGQCHYPRYQQTCKEPTFLEWVRSWLPTDSRISGPHPSGKYQYWLLSSRTNAIYAPAFQHWYPEGKKRLPADLQISPELLLTEYLGDGFLLADAQKKLQHLELGTYGFEEQSVIGLLPKLKQQKLDFRRLPNNALSLRGSQVINFLRYVGPCPVLALSYKWSAISVGRHPVASYCLGGTTGHSKTIWRCSSNHFRMWAYISQASIKTTVGPYGNGDLWIM